MKDNQSIILMNDIRTRLYNRIMEHIVGKYFTEQHSETPIELTEDELDDGFDFRHGTKEIYFNPKKQYNADTAIFTDNNDESEDSPKKKQFKVRKMFLPKSQVMSYNLYDIQRMDINKALKHHTDNKGHQITYGTATTPSGFEYNTIEWFIKRSAMYIKSLIGNNQVDIITYPHSSSKFNNTMVSTLHQMFPKSEGIRLIPELLSKNPRNIFVNVDAAREAGLTDEDIRTAQKYVEGIQKNEDIRLVREQIDELTEKIAYIIQNRKRGRPSNEFRTMQQELELLKAKTKEMRKGVLGRDSTYNKKTNKTKEWQIKSIPDKQRRAIEGIFEINPKYRDIQYKLKGKSVVVFDDNISSGATLDDVCLALQKLGVKEIMPFTLGVIPVAIYNPIDRQQAYTPKKKKKVEESYVPSKKFSFIDTCVNMDADELMEITHFDEYADNEYCISDEYLDSGTIEIIPTEDALRMTFGPKPKESEIEFCAINHKMNMLFIYTSDDIHWIYE